RLGIGLRLGLRLRHRRGFRRRLDGLGRRGLLPLEEVAAPRTEDGVRLVAEAAPTADGHVAPFSGLVGEPHYRAPRPSRRPSPSEVAAVNDVCTGCGEPNPPGTQFCLFCGIYLGWEERDGGRPGGPAPRGSAADGTDKGWTGAA